MNEGKVKEGERVNTLTLIKRDAQQYTIPNLSHVKLLLSVLDGNRFWVERIKLNLVEGGFTWFVTLEAVLRLKYHAIVRKPAPCFFSSRDLDLYNGDIPDSALIRAAKALELGIKMITIHSMQPMPVQRVHFDPVMVGWWDDPHILQTSNGAICSHQPHSKEKEGVIVAIWNGEKEISLL